MEWKEVRLGDIADVQTGPFGSQLHKSDYIAEGIPCIMPTNIGPHLNFIVDGIAHVSEVDANRLSRHLTEIGDIIYARRGDIEKCAYVTTNEEKWLCGTGCLKIRCNNEVNSRFIAYLLSTAECKKWITGNAVGTTMLNLSKGILSNLPLLVPSLADQRRITSILSSLDRKIELNNKINADLEEMAQAIFKNWFVDFEPFKDGKFVDSELGMIPEGWKVGTLADIAEITMGQSPAGNSLNENREGMIFYQGSSDFGFRFPSIRVFTTEPKRLAVANSVLFSVRAPVGDINVAKEECCIGRGVASIKSKYGHDSYLFYTMKSLHKLFDSFDGEGTVFGSINKKTLSAIQILLPSDGIVEQFNNIASSFDDRIRSLSDESSRLSLLRDTLLPRLMSGELEVPE